jgi:hypothetical protein
MTPKFDLGGDWGDMCNEDARLNDAALVDGRRLQSAYCTLNGEAIWVLTEAADDQGLRAVTTLLRPDEY